jgi:hypothetical protein
LFYSGMFNIMFERTRPNFMCLENWHRIIFHLKHKLLLLFCLLKRNRNRQKRKKSWARLSLQYPWYFLSNTYFFLYVGVLFSIPPTHVKKTAFCLCLSRFMFYFPVRFLLCWWSRKLLVREQAWGIQGEMK